MLSSAVGCVRMRIRFDSLSQAEKNKFLKRDTNHGVTDCSTFSPKCSGGCAEWWKQKKQVNLPSVMAGRAQTMTT